MKTIVLHPTLNPFAFYTVRTYRGLTKSQVSKKVAGVSVKDISSFENGDLTAISLDNLKEAMKVMDWPFDFLYSNINPNESLSTALYQKVKQ